MEQFEKRRIDEVTVLIDRLICVGFEDCIALAPEVLELDGDGVAAFRDPLPTSVDPIQVLEAARACPVDAIVVLDGEGEQLHP